MASYQDEQLRRLKDLLEHDAVAQKEVIAFITTKSDGSNGCLGCASISDLASFFTDRDYETELKTEVLDKTVAKDDRLQLARLRTAVRLCKVEMEQALKKRESGTQEVDLDAPLDDGTRRRVEKDFTVAYALVFSEDVKPSESFLGQLVREFTKKNFSVYPLWKVRSAS